jgi:hypothetical protein
MEPETLHEVLDGVLDGLFTCDPGGLTDAQVHDTVISLQRAEARLTGLSMRWLQVWDARGLWQDDGSRSPAARLAREANLAPIHASIAIRRARQLANMPATSAALQAGEITAGHVDLLAKANAHEWPNASFEYSENMLVEFCRTLRFNQARKAVDYWIARADPNGDEQRHDHLHRQRAFTASPTIDGVVHLHGVLAPVGGAAFIAELERLEHRLYLQDQHDNIIRTPTQRRADALVEMATRSRTATDGGLRPRPLITVLMGEQSFARTCELANGHLIAPGQVVPLLTQADIERVIFDGPNRVISVSRKRTFTGALRRAIELRDRTCTHPSGCDTPANHCDIDHTLPHSHGGLTDQHNGRLHCPTHNRNHHLRNRQPGHRNHNNNDDDHHEEQNHDDDNDA